MDTDTTTSETTESTETSGIDGYEGKDGAKEGGEFDYANAFKSTSQELTATKGQLETYRQKLEGVQRQAEESGAVVQRLKEAFSPDGGKGEPDPVADWERQRDHYLEQALKAEKAGRPITLTTNLAVQFFDDKIKAHKAEKANNDKISKLEETIKTLTDPNREVDHRAASHIDSLIVSTVEMLYGNDEKSYEQRAAQYHAIASQVRKQIEQLKPATWEQIRRSPEKQKKLVEFVAEQNQPPKVRQILEQERLKNTPLSVGELKAAFAEAQKLKDPVQREKETADIRQQILSLSFGQKRTRQGVGRMYG